MTELDVREIENGSVLCTGAGRVEGQQLNHMSV